MTHPLTDEICDEIFKHNLQKCDEKYYEWQNRALRAAADWQLKRDTEELNQMLYVFELAGKIDEADRVGLLKVFKEAMRPPEDNS